MRKKKKKKKKADDYFYLEYLSSRSQVFYKKANLIT